MNNKRVTRRDILFLSISLFIVVVAWIGFSIYHAYVTTTISPDLQIQITPIDPKFDTAVINALKPRQKIEPLLDSSSLGLNLVSLSVTPTPQAVQFIVSPTPVASESAQPDLSPTDIPTPTEVTPTP